MLLGLTCGSKSDDYLTRKRLATAQTGKWRTNSNGLDWNGEGVSILKKGNIECLKKTEIALKLLRSAEIFIDIIVP